MLQNTPLLWRVERGGGGAGGGGGRGEEVVGYKHDIFKINKSILVRSHLQRNCMVHTDLHFLNVCNKFAWWWFWISETCSEVLCQTVHFLCTTMWCDVTTETSHQLCHNYRTNKRSPAQPKWKQQQQQHNNAHSLPCSVTMVTQHLKHLIPNHATYI